MARWKQHFESLLNIHDVTNHTPIAAEQTQVADSITGSINTLEVQQAIKKLKRGKAVGSDQISSSMLNALGPRGIEFITTFFNISYIQFP